MLNIKNLFEDDCLGKDQARIASIVSSTEELMTQIETGRTKLAESGQSGLDGSGPLIGEDASQYLTGQNMSLVLGNLNTVLSYDRCMLKNKSFLQFSAELVQNFSQMGLLVPSSNGLIVAGGGMIFSSLLRFMDVILEERFDFNNSEDRQTFIKLNCGFWDLRREIEESGLLDVPSQTHRDDLASVQELIKQLGKKLKATAEYEQAALKIIDKDKKAYIETHQGELSELEKNIDLGLQILKTPIKDHADLPAQTYKLQLINELTILRPKLVAGLKTYIEQGLGKIPVMDMLFLKELGRFDPIDSDSYMALLEMDVKTFNHQIRGNLYFHFERVKKDVDGSKNELAKMWEAQTLIDGISVKKYYKELKLNTGKHLAKLTKTLNQLIAMKKRLERTLEQDGYVSTDDGTENLVTLLDSMQDVSEEIYGSKGLDFLEYTTGHAKKNNDEFNGKFESFAKKYLERAYDEDFDYMVKKSEDMGSLGVLYACQDARPYRRLWLLGQGLAGQAYDFVATNKELFHSDVPRIFLGSSGGRFGLHSAKSKYEKIRMHYKSSLYAKKLILGEELPFEVKRQYLKGDYLGRVMLEVEVSKKRAQVLQSLIEEYDCNYLVSTDADARVK